MDLGGSFLSADSESNAYDQRAAAADQAALAYGKGSQVGTVNVGPKGKMQTGGLDVSGATVGKGGTLALTFNDPSAFQDALQVVEDVTNKNTDALNAALSASGDTLNAALSASGDQLNQALQATSDQIKTALGQIAGLTESSQTGGDSGRNKIILWIVMGLLGLVGLIFYFRR